MAEANNTSALKKMLHYSDIGMAGLVMLIVVMMIIPLPTWLLDILLTVNISIGVVVLLATFYAERALDLAAFPTMRHVTLRLALTSQPQGSSWLNGDAGQVVRLETSLWEGTTVGAVVS